MPKWHILGTSLVVQWVRFHAPNAGGPSSIPDQGTRSHLHAATKSPHAATNSPRGATKTQHGQKKIKNKK